MDIHNTDKHFSQAFYFYVNAHAIHPVFVQLTLIQVSRDLYGPPGLMTQNLGTKQENLFHENLLSMRG